MTPNDGRREKLGQNARKTVQEYLGAVDWTVEMVINGIKNSGVYVAPLQKRELQLAQAKRRLAS
jgi:hypothetical protein